MGYWNTTCGISNLPIHSGEEVVVFLLIQNEFNFLKDFVGIDTYFKPCLLPFYGHYNDYGDVEDCSGVGLPVLLDQLRKKVTEMPVGENEYHDIAVVRSELTNTAEGSDKLFQLDREDRLFMKNPYGYEPKQLKIAHVQIKKSIFDYILENWEQEQWISSGKYKKFKFKDILKSWNKDVPKYKKLIEKESYLRSYMIDDFLDREKLYAPYLWEQLGNSILSVKEVIGGRDWKDDGVHDPYTLIPEMLKGGFINHFMRATRKPWIKPIGNGMQHTEHEPYILLNDAMKVVMDQERKEGDW